MTRNFCYLENSFVMKTPAPKKSVSPHERAFHPLFPAPLDADPADLARRDICWLYVWRDKEPLHAGPLPREDLSDPNDLVQRWGGGVYEIRSKDVEKKYWTANAMYTFTGPRKAFNAPDPTHAPAMPHAPAPSSDLGAAVPVVTGFVGAFMPLVTAWLDRADRRYEQERRDEERREERRRQDEEERRRLEDKREDERRRLEDKREERERQFMQQQAAQTQQTMQLIVGLSQNQTGTAQTLAALEKGLQIGQQVGANSDDDVLESIGQFMGGFASQRQGHGHGQGQPN